MTRLEVDFDAPKGGAGEVKIEMRVVRESTTRRERAAFEARLAYDCKKYLWLMLETVREKLQKEGAKA